MLLCCCLGYILLFLAIPLILWRFPNYFSTVGGHSTRPRGGGGRAMGPVLVSDLRCGLTDISSRSSTCMSVLQLFQAESRFLPRDKKKESNAIIFFFPFLFRIVF